MKRLVSVLTVFIIAAYCVALSLFALSIFRAYTSAVPHISPEALLDATLVPLFIVLPSTVAAFIMAIVTSKKANKVSDSSLNDLGGADIADTPAPSTMGSEMPPPVTSEADSQLVAPVTDAQCEAECASKLIADEIAATPDDIASPAIASADDIASPAAIAATDSAPCENTPPSEATVPECAASVPKPLEWHLSPPPSVSLYGAANEGTEKVIATYELTPDADSEEPLECAKTKTPASVFQDNHGEAIPATAEIAKQAAEERPTATAKMPGPPPDVLSGSEALAQFSESNVDEESPLEASLSHKLVNAAADERDLSLVFIESDAIDIDQSKEALDEAFKEHEIFKQGENTYALVKVGMTLDEALSAAEKAYHAITDKGGQCAMGISSRSIRLISSATLLREALAALEKAKTEETPIMAFRADTDKYRAALLSP